MGVLFILHFLFFIPPIFSLLAIALLAWSLGMTTDVFIHNFFSAAEQTDRRFFLVSEAAAEVHSNRAGQGRVAGWEQSIRAVQEKKSL
jgi:hypothetical protein